MHIYIYIYIFVVQTPIRAAGVNPVMKELGIMNVIIIIIIIITIIIITIIIIIIINVCIIIIVIFIRSITNTHSINNHISLCFCYCLSSSGHARPSELLRVIREEVDRLAVLETAHGLLVDRLPSDLPAKLDSVLGRRDAGVALHHLGGHEDGSKHVSEEAGSQAARQQGSQAVRQQGSQAIDSLCIRP